MVYHTRWGFTMAGHQWRSWFPSRWEREKEIWSTGIMRLPWGRAEGLPGLQVVAAHYVLAPVWPVAHWPSCFPLHIFGSWTEPEATATVASVPAMEEDWNPFGKGIQLPWLLRSRHHNLDSYLDTAFLGERGKTLHGAQYTASSIHLILDVLVYRLCSPYRKDH